jgi:hypothetical protein
MMSFIFQHYVVLLYGALLFVSAVDEFWYSDLSTSCCVYMDCLCLSVF